MDAHLQATVRTLYRAARTAEELALRPHNRGDEDFAAREAAADALYARIAALREGLAPTCREASEVGRHQRLAAIEFRAEIPGVPPHGKVPKRQLREPYWAARS